MVTRVSILLAMPTGVGTVGDVHPGVVRFCRTPRVLLFRMKRYGKSP